MKWQRCIVAAPGPSLTEEVAERLHGHHVIAVNDAWRRVPFADALFAADPRWWNLRGPTSDEFDGERWMSLSPQHAKDANETAKRLGLRIIKSREGELFCFEPGMIHHGYIGNSGFQAVNLALQWGATHLILVGFDMRRVDGQDHFWGTYQGPPFHSPLPVFAAAPSGFAAAAKVLAPDVRIVNATPGSALTCFPMLSLEDALDDCVLWHRAHDHAAAG